MGIASLLGGILVLCFSLVDFVAYRELFAQFFILRCICSAIIFSIGLVSKTKWARRRYNLVDLMVPSVAGLFISYFIYLINDATTFYYAGLNLCIVGAATLFHRSALISTVLIISFVAITLPTLSQLTESTWPIYFGSLLFLVSTGIIAYLGNQLLKRSRRREFQASRKNIEHQHFLELANEELRHTQTQLFQSEKMSFFGQISAGVIHEIGNPLNYTISALYLLRKQGSYDPKATEKLDDIKDGLDRIQGIITNLQEFSHIGRGGGAQLPLTESIESALKILSGPIGDANLAIEKNIDDSVVAFGFKNQITQVMTNLIHNAIQAISECDRPGKLTLTVENDGENARIIVEDNGPGIPEELVDSLFTPFFTTKDPGVGTGLGLSICFRIIESHEGEIDVDTDLGEGTRFTILLPRFQS